MSQRFYAIGDIHGYLDKLEEVHTWIAADRLHTGDSTAPVIHIGDLVDRGPDARGVLDFLIQGHDRQEPWIVLKGNHDRMFEGFLNDPNHHDPELRPDLEWVHPRLGGLDTLASYGINAWSRQDNDALHGQAIAKVPQRHRDYLETLPYSYSAPGVFFAHAGIRPGVALDEQTQDDLCWIRKPFVDDRSDHGALIVHGHTPIECVTHYRNAP